MERKKILSVAGWFGLFQKQPALKKAIISLLLSVGALGLLYLIYSLAFLGRIYPNVRVGDVSLGGKTVAQAERYLHAQLEKNLADPMKLQHGDKTLELLPKDINWNYDPQLTVAAAYEVGRQGVSWASFLDQISSPFLTHRLAATVEYDNDTLDQRLTALAESVDEPAVDASAAYVGDKLMITKEQVGKRINRAEVTAAVLARWASFSPSAIMLETEFDLPKVVVANAEELQATADRLAQASLILTWTGGRKTLTKREIRQLIDFAGTDGANEQKNLTARFTPEKVKTFLIEVAKGIDRPAIEPKLIIKDGQLAVAQKASSGQIVDAEASAQPAFNALQTMAADATAALILKAQEPVIREDNLVSLGIKERIARAETNFTGSPANRRANIVNGINLLQSALIKPGEEFSTVKTLGRVDDTTGFLPELVIKENRTTPEFGGGLCQVSTTLFRAVMNAGLKVTERQNHSYRVGYYEPPIGMDATIYLPKPDFKFFNDTAASVLVQGEVRGNKVIFELWGTSDGRTTSLSTPVVSNIKDPGEPIYAETDTLFRGETKQIEKPHQGATAVFTYTVTRNGEVINKQTFKSIYKVWPARFLVGTKEPPPPAETPAP